MKTGNFETTMVDVFNVAFAGGQGTPEEVYGHFIHAIEQYNEQHGTNLVFMIEED